MRCFLKVVFSSSLLLIVSACQNIDVSKVTAADDNTTAAFKLLTKSSHWQLTDVIDIDFQAYHTQGMVKIGDIFYVSAVEKLLPTETYAKTDALWDFSLTRTTGKGRGWLFKFNSKGKLLDKVELTNGDAFHPGGIDFDGKYIWVSVAEYRPNSASDIYRVDPKTMAATLSFRVNDHIGNIIHNTDRNVFVGTSWGGRRIYQWQINFDESGSGKVTSENWSANTSHYIDYQDCQYNGINYMLCSGLQKYNTPTGTIALGGLELIDISNKQPLTHHVVPVAQYWDKQLSLNNAEMTVAANPFWAEGTKENQDLNILRVYYMPDNGATSKLLVYDVTSPFLPHNN